MKKENPNDSGDWTFDELFNAALKRLKIEDYRERIFNSNSRGELFHLNDYIMIAKFLPDNGNDNWFRAGFEKAIIFAEENWDRPESVFQHIPRMMSDSRGAN